MKRIPHIKIEQGGKALDRGWKIGLEDAMRLQFRTNGGELEDGLKSRVERRFRFAAGRFGVQVGRITLHLIDPSGPEPACRVVIQGAGRDALTVEVRGKSLAEAIEFSVDRAVRALERGMELRDEVGSNLAGNGR